MTLRGDIRDYFEGEAVAYPTPAGLRASVAADVSRGRVAEPRGMRLAAFVAVALTIAIVAGLVAANALRHNNAPLPVIKPGQHGIVLDANAVDESYGWALLGQCNPTNATVTATCPYWVESTRDGGRTWVDPVQIGSYLITDGDAPRHIHFVDRMNGFVYGNTVAYATHDGGATWSSTLTSATGIVAINGTGPAWAVIYPCAKGTQCAYEVFLSSDGGKSWKQTSALPAGFSPRYAVPFGSDGLLLTSFGAGDMEITYDGGATWATIAGQCEADATENEVATPNGRQILQYCGRLPALQSTVGRGDYFAVSEDAGRTWARRPGIPAATNGAVFFSPQRDIEFMLPAAGGSELLTSRDGGRSWQAVGGPANLTSVSWDGPVMWAVDDRYEIWTTNDAGVTWTRLPAQP